MVLEQLDIHMQKRKKQEDSRQMISEPEQE